MDAILQRRPDTAFERFLENPLLFFAQKAYYFQAKHLIIPTPVPSPIRVVCISDTHNHHGELPSLPDGDILIHAGDLTRSGTAEEVQSALGWLSSQPHAHKIVIAGNHDRALVGSGAARMLVPHPALTYLDEAAATITVRGRVLHIYGSPQTPKHGSWPFQYSRSDPVATARWDNIPLHTDVLVTHGPPAHHADGGRGCAALLTAAWRVRPRLHVCGHIHLARGIEHIAWSAAQAAYERICARSGNWWDLLAVLWRVENVAACHGADYTGERCVYWGLQRRGAERTHCC